MATFIMNNRDAAQAYVYTRSNGMATGTFKIRAIFFHVEGDTCEVRCTWSADSIFRKGVVVRPVPAANICESGVRFCLDTRGAMASVVAELEANDTNCIARAALLEFARAVEDCWSVRSFLLNLCEEV